jgi:hypothetical protein
MKELAAQDKVKRVGMSRLLRLFTSKV